MNARSFRFAVLSVLWVTAGLTAPAASADTFSYTFSGAIHSGSGSGIAVPDSQYANYFDIVSGTFFVDGAQVSLVDDQMRGDRFIQSPHDNQFAFNNYLVKSPGSTSADLDAFLGILLELDNTYYLNLYIDRPSPGDPGGHVDYYELTQQTEPISFSASIYPASTPEPSGVVLLGTGLLGVAQAARRRYSR